jgi:hypothetical protein
MLANIPGGKLMPRKATNEEIMQDYREIPAYPDYEVTIIGKVRNKTSKLMIDPFMVQGQERKGIHVNLFVQGVRETIDVYSLVQNTFYK